MSNTKKTSSAFFLICSLCAVAASGQTVVNTQKPPPFGKTTRQLQEDDFDRRTRELDARMGISSYSSTYTGYARRAPSLSRAERARIAAILAPGAADAAKYKEFLQQKNTGLFRLFPDFDCAGENVVRVDGDCADLVPGSWNYSFRAENYSDADYSDLLFKDGKLIAEGYLSQGILVRLGDVPLETVSAATGGVKALLDFAPETANALVKKQFARIVEGFSVGDYRYARSVRAEENTTYALRVVAYKIQDKLVFRLSPQSNAESLKLSNLNYADKRKDLTVAFRVVRRDANGSLTLLWKELDKQDAPKIVFDKGERPTDFKAGK